MEKPFLANNDCIKGKVDGIIDIHGGVFRRLVYQIKPVMSGYMSEGTGQIKSYAEWLKYGWFGKERDRWLRLPDMAIVTTDRNTVFDDMLLSQGIHVYHIPRSEIFESEYPFRLKTQLEELPEQSDSDDLFWGDA